MRDFNEEIKLRVEFIKEILEESGADGIVYGNSGGKDSALTGILCKKACENTVGIIMPCISASNYQSDMKDALLLAEKFGIETRKVDLSITASDIKVAIGAAVNITQAAATNIAPRLRMTALYTIAASENRLVAGTGNKSEFHMGYFTKWGDGAYDFNPIADLTVKEIFEFLKFLEAPESIITKPPSAGLFDGQTDETEMGVTYKVIDEYLQGGTCSDEELEIINRFHKATEHKRVSPKVYNNVC